MTAFPDHYAALGIDPTADHEVIGAAYRALAKKYHPDTGATKGTASAERFAEIQQAYEVLGSPESRKQYDRELLDATQRELDEHLARKQRKITGATEDPPPPDLGAIRPERRGGRSKAKGAAVSLKEMGPFLVVSALLMALAGGFASLYLRHAPLPPVEEPPPPPVASQLAPAPAAAPPEAPVQQAEAPRDPPLFGTSMLEEPAAPPPVQEAAAEAPPPAPEQEQAVAAPVPPPVPKAKPPREAAAPKAPAPDEEAAPAPRTVEARAQRFTVVIYEKYRTGDIVQEEGRILFASEQRCAAFGERAVLRRLAPYEGQRQRPRIWYECVEAR